jgi:hypothetical protein
VLALGRELLELWLGGRGRQRHLLVGFGQDRLATGFQRVLLGRERVKRHLAALGDEVDLIVEVREVRHVALDGLHDVLQERDASHKRLGLRELDERAERKALNRVVGDRAKVEQVADLKNINK